MSHPTTEHDVAPARRPQGRPPIRRRRYIVDPTFQWNVIWRVTAQSLFTLLLVSLCLLGPLLAELLSDNPSAAFEEMAVVMLYMHQRWWWIAGLSLLCAGLAALRMSHRIAGPLVRFNRNLRWLGQGRFAEPLRTRPGDYLKPEVDILNASIAGLQQRIERLQNEHGTAVAELRHALQELDISGERQAQAAVHAAHAAVLRLGDQLAQFGPITHTDALRDVPHPAAHPSPAPAR
ncbi:MAG: hypothetical protein AB7O97_08090 [Planctomycetota bacterium]